MERFPYRLTGVVALLITSAPISAAIIFDGNYVRAAADINAGNGSSSGGDFIFTGTNFTDTGVIEFNNGAILSCPVLALLCKDNTAIDSNSNMKLHYRITTRTT